MAASQLVDLVKIVITSIGNGPLVLGPAVVGFDGASALRDGLQYSYSIESASHDWEVGTGIWIAASNTLVRSVQKSSFGNSPIEVVPGDAVSFVARAADLLAITGVGTVDAASAYSVRDALADRGVLQTVIDALPADPTDPIRVQWDAAGAIRLNDSVANHIRTVLGYTDDQMRTLLLPDGSYLAQGPKGNTGSSATVTMPSVVAALGGTPPRPNGVQTVTFLQRLEQLGAGNYFKLMGGVSDDQIMVQIQLRHAPTLYQDDALLRAAVEATTNVTDGQFDGLFA